MSYLCSLDVPFLKISLLIYFLNLLLSDSVFQSLICLHLPVSASFAAGFQSVPVPLADIQEVTVYILSLFFKRLVIAFSVDLLIVLKE
jgi:hypothetical protein